MAIIYVDGAAMPSPSGIRIEFQDVGDDSARNALGKRLVDRIAVKRLISIEWSRVDADDLQTLMEAVSGNAFFTAVYPDPATGTQRTAVCRAVERSANVYRVTGGVPEWADVAMKWEER